MIRRELGKDAVILNTRKIWVAQWFGLWRRRRIEVVAATGDDVPRRAPTPLRTPEIESRAASGYGVGLQSAATSPQFDRIQTEDRTDEVKQIWNEIKQLKQHIDSTTRTRSSEQWVQRFHEHLLAQQVNPAHVRALMDRCAQLQQIPGGGYGVTPQTFESVRQSFMEAAKEAFGPLYRAKALEHNSRVVAFIGPTGVGKTTTIAKLAALHVLAGDRKVGLITTDTFRIAAVDQLRTYANILNVPLQVAYQPSELPNAVAALDNCDLIMVDTAGRNFTKDKPIEEIRALFNATPFDEIHLVLSLTTKGEDMDALITAFQNLPITQVLLTKIDETRTYGAFINLLMQFGRPLSYVTMGQNVPDDIAQASTERLLKLTAGGAIS